MPRNTDPDPNDSRKANARRRRHAFKNLKRLWKRGLLDSREHERLFGELSRRYAG